MGSIFDSSKLFTRYHARIQLRDRLVGGTPLDPQVIEKWIRAKAGVTDEQEISKMVFRTMTEIAGSALPGDNIGTVALMERASEQIAATKSTVGFKRDAKGLYIETRCIKAMLKESTNVVFGKQSEMGTDGKAKQIEWGKRRSGAKNFVAETVFVEGDKVYLGQLQPDDVDLFIGHTNGKDGPQSNLTYYESVRQPVIEFDVIVARDEISADKWAMIWIHAQENGLGSLRSQGCGRFDVEAWDLVK